MISNYTRLDEQKLNWATTMLNLTSARPSEGTPDPRALTQDLIIVEWSHKYVRFNFVRGGGVDEECLRQAFADLAATGGDTDNPTSKAEAITFATSAVWYNEGLDADEREASYHEAEETFDDRSKQCAYGSVICGLSNINYAYSVLWKYLELAIPPQLQTKKGDAMNPVLENYVWAWLYRQNHKGGNGMALLGALMAA